MLDAAAGRTTPVAEVLANAAHEMRAPLAVIQQALDLIEVDHADLSIAELLRCVRSARAGVHRLRVLADSVASATPTGSFVVDTRPVELAAVIDECRGPLELLLSARRQRLESAPFRAGLRVIADDRLLPVVVWNLVLNASKYGPQGAPIQLTVREEDAVARVIVEDRGTGIPPQNVPAVFERYYRGDAPRSIEGVGLGLAIAREIVDAHRGGMGIDSEVGRGTSVWFTLPLAPDES